MITDYLTLKAEISAWVMRDDLVDYIPSFIQLAEAAMNENLRCREMVTRAQVIAYDRFIPLPYDWREARNIQKVDGPTYRFVTPEGMDGLKTGQQRPDSNSAGWYSLFDDVMEVYPAPTEDAPRQIEMVYFADVPALGDNRATNDVLARNPNLYLYGALVHTAPFLLDDARLPVWTSLYQSSLEAVNRADGRARYSGGPLVLPQRGFE